MKIFNREQEATTGSSIKRISKLETVAVKTWFDTTLISLGNVYDQWRYHDGPADEISDHLTILNELWKELQSRS